MKNPKDLDEAFALYKEGKIFGKPGEGSRHAMLSMLVDAVKDLQARIGAVDEAAVNDLRKRIDALETVIGNALANAPSRYAQMGADGKLYTLTDSGEWAAPGSDSPAKRGPGRPKREAA